MITAEPESMVPLYEEISESLVSIQKAEEIIAQSFHTQVESVIHFCLTVLTV